MSNYQRPSFAELTARISADLDLIPRVLAEPLSAMWARACHGQYGYLDWILAQCSPLTCELDRLYNWAALYGVTRLLPVAAKGAVFATGNVGAEILAGTLLRGQNGFTYQVSSAVTLSVAKTALSVRCSTRGKATNMGVGEVLTLIDPVLSVNSTMVVAAQGLGGGADYEPVDAWRVRVADEWQAVVKFGGRSGKPADYVAWSKAAHPSVSGALVQPHALGIGTVLVQPVCNELPNRLPTQAVINAVIAYFATVAPAVADWRVAVPVVKPVIIKIDLSASIDSQENRQAISAVLAGLVGTKTASLATLTTSEIDTAVLSVASRYIRIAPTATITAATGEVLVLSPVVFN